MLNLWDCGGQDVYYENYFNARREHTFRNVAVSSTPCSRLWSKTITPDSQVLIYVFDASSEDLESDLVYYASTAEALVQHSPGARVFVLLHKMDLVAEAERESVFRERSGAAVVHVVCVTRHANSAALSLAQP